MHKPTKLMFYFSSTRKPNFRDIEEIDYNRYWRERGFVLNDKLKEREKIILDELPKNSSALDIGCGNSLLPIKLKEKGCKVTVADISTSVLQGFKERSIEAFEIDLENPSKLNFGRNFDYIILSEVLEHTKNPEAILKRLKNYTKKFIISIPNSAFYRYRFHLLFTGRFFTQWVYHPSEHLRFWSHIDFLEWLEALGLKVEKSIASNGFSLFGLLPSLKNSWKNLFGHQIVYFIKVS